jgi:hypothetical protein
VSDFGETTISTVITVKLTARMNTLDSTKKDRYNSVMGNIKTLRPFQSGPDPRRNTKGRPKGSRNMSTLFREALKEKVEVNGQKITLFEAIALRVATKAARGSLKAAQMVMDRVDGKVPETVEPPRPPYVPPKEVVLTPEEQEAYEKYFKRKDHV